jgi:hypothetical protein
MTLSGNCRIVSVGKRRDGGTRFWCLEHRADATAKYGRRGRKCRHAHLPPILPDQVLRLDVDSFRGGVAIWGAVPPIYDTTRTAVQQGIHVHARRSPGGPKEIDGTFRQVLLLQSIRSPGIELVISELEAVYYMVSSVFAFPMKLVKCSLCGAPHLDKDWFSIHPHRRHLCAACGRHFRDSEHSIGNPIAAVSHIFGRRSHATKGSTKTIDLDQSKLKGGIQIWGSNAALLWTARRSEEDGIHVHALADDGITTATDDTFARVTVDGMELDPAMVRTLMAQSALPHIAGRVVGIRCPRCGVAHFDCGENAYTPHDQHSCEKCGAEFRSTGRLRRTIGNPLVAILSGLGASAHQSPQQHRSELLVETI